jgi:hypothetical protein
VRRLQCAQLYLNTIAGRRGDLKLAAAELGVSQSLISRWRRGDEAPSRAHLAVLRRLAARSARTD